MSDICYACKKPANGLVIPPGWDKAICHPCANDAQRVRAPGPASRTPVREERAKKVGRMTKKERRAALLAKIREEYDA